MSIIIFYFLGCGRAYSGSGDTTDSQSPLGKSYPIDGAVDFSDFGPIYEQTVNSWEDCVQISLEFIISIGHRCQVYVPGLSVIL